MEYDLDDAIVLLLGMPIQGKSVAEIRGITRLEKLVFLLENETSSSEWLRQKGEFIAYNFGPFSEKVYQAVDVLSAANIIEDSYSLAKDDADLWEQKENIGLDIGSDDSVTNTTRNFRLTEKGLRYFAILEKELPKKYSVEIQNLKNNFAFLPLRQLIKYVYLKYESMTTNSLIKEDIIGKPR